MDSIPPKKPAKKPVMKPMFIKKKVLQKNKPKPTTAEAVPSSSTPITLTGGSSSLKSPSSSQDSDIIDITDKVVENRKKDEEKKEELNDLAFWGRSQAVHAGMLKLERERHLKSKLAREAEKQKEDSQRSTRSSKRRKSDENNAIRLSDDENSGEDDEDRPRKSRDGTRSPTATTSTTVESLNPAEFDKILAAFKEKRATEEAAATLKSIQGAGAAYLSEPTSTQVPANSQRAASADPTETFKDVVIQILIVSNIEGTKPFVFNRKYSQTLGKVRETWGKMQNFNEDQLDRLILVWLNETRAFDSTVPKSLGIRFDKEGKMYVEDKSKRTSAARRDMEEQAALQQGIAPGECRVYFTAMWIEDFEEMLRKREEAREKEREKESWELSEPEDDEVLTGITLNSKPMIITLRGKNFEELKLKVKPNMKINQVIDMIKETRSLDEDVDIELHFDGDELEEDMTLEDAEIEHEFQIDVVLR
ncbi:hypothetical protein TWF694_003380 [Orbilia ellipsospora]|uniref:Ubiquitin-like domain-containing protein n=1 Tax=Orbilia ellipsospora TaxID=2528407 RepID=A0AAV9WY02_9PEZI